MRSLDDLGLLRLSGITPNVHPKLPGATSHAAFEDDIVGVEVVDSPDVLLHFGNGETLSPINIQHADQQSIDLVRDWQDCGEEAGGVLEVCTEGGVVQGGGLPWVAASEKVEENDAEGPDIIVQGRIRAVVSKLSTVTFWAHVIGAARSELLTECIGSGQPEIGDGKT